MEAISENTKARAGVPGKLRAAAQWWHRAVTGGGEERNTLLVIGKSTFAATLSWAIAADVLDAHSPAFAPFSAVLIMQVTVYRSLVQSLRYVAAVVAGVMVQAALGLFAGPELLTFALGPSSP
ncbi:aromatic acid exporter family protein [Streptomyces sp. NBC_00178]|uniref:aromatic acid exporter family protein n=1 Tax=Streptomyces sp. NBC_00178 TaxID=2975672 RepID=UPI002E2D61F4|nr:aromatic acid exporter family protein [Streptomyces sp. NBC_00178]